MAWPGRALTDAPGCGEASFRVQNDASPKLPYLLRAYSDGTADSRPRSLWYGVGQKLKGGSCKGMHVGEPLGAAGLEHPGRRDMDADDLTATALALAFPCK
jgi:hypothetical protein